MSNYVDPDDYELDGPEIRITAQESEDAFEHWQREEFDEENCTTDGVYLGDGIYIPQENLVCQN